LSIEAAIVAAMSLHTIPISTLAAQALKMLKWIQAEHTNAVHLCSLPKI
jgi:hypothetical protein